MLYSFTSSMNRRFSMSYYINAILGNDAILLHIKSCTLAFRGRQDSWNCFRLGIIVYRALQHLRTGDHSWIQRVIENLPCSLQYSLKIVHSTLQNTNNIAQEAFQCVALTWLVALSCWYFQSTRHTRPENDTISVSIRLAITSAFPLPSTSNRGLLRVHKIATYII